MRGRCLQQAVISKRKRVIINHLPAGRWQNETETVATSKQKHCPSLQASIFPDYKGSKVNPARYKPWLKVTARILTTNDHESKDARSRETTA